ncbi:MAG: DUF2079 domain-containing protein [Polyangia bacterium]|jgi:uncharacterized membrane protein
MSVPTFDPFGAPPADPSQGQNADPPSVVVEADAGPPPQIAPPSLPPPSLPPLTRAIRALGLLTAEGASLGLAGWFVRVQDRLLPYVMNNALPPRARKFVIGDIAAGALLLPLIGLIGIIWKRLGGLAAVERVARRLAPLSLIGFLPLFFNWELWYQGRELTFLGLVSVFLLGLQGLLRVSFEAGPILPASLRTRLVLPVSRALARLSTVRWLPFTIVVLGWVGYTIYFSVITLQHHFRLETMGWDLGIENNLVWNAAHFNRPLFKTSIIGGPESTHLGFHETYISYLMGIFYRLAPRPQTLLVYQAAVVGGAALPLYAFARRHVGDWTACLLSILLLMYAPLQGSNLYDFHYLPFAPFFLWWCLWALESRRNVMATIAVILTLANREDMSALLMVVGLYLVLTGERPRAGLLVAAISAVYFVVVKLILMPHFLNGYPAYINQYEGLLPEGDTGFGGVLKTVFANPAFTMTNLLERDKLVYVLEIVAPLAFFPWRRPIALLCVVPGFIFTMLATHYPPLIQISFQYTAYWTSFLFIAIVANLAWIRRNEAAGLPGATRSRRAWLVVMTAGVLITSYQFGVVLQRHTAWGGFSPFRVGVTQADRTRHDDLYSLIAKIPQDASVAASESVVAHISSRKNAYSLRVAFNEADYVLARLPAGGDDRNNLLNALRTRHYGVLAQKGEFVLFKHGLPPDTAQVFIRQLGG